MPNTTKKKLAAIMFTRLVEYEKYSDNDEKFALEVLKEHEKIIANDIYPLSKVREKLSRQINILLTTDQNDANLLQKIKDISAENKGHCALMLHLRDENGNIKHIRANHISVNPDHNFIMNLRKLLGQKNVWIS